MDIKTAHINLTKLRRTVAGIRKGAAIARHLNVATNTVNRWLSGDIPLTLERLNEICQLIEMDVDEFLEIKKAA